MKPGSNDSYSNETRIHCTIVFFNQFLFMVVCIMLVLTPFFECPPARDPAQQTGLQLVCGLGQAGGQGQCSC